MKKIDRITIGAVIVIAFGLFQFWPFALSFVTVGMVATIVIRALSGYAVSFFLVLAVPVCSYGGIYDHHNICIPKAPLNRNLTIAGHRPKIGGLFYFLLKN